MGPRGEDGPEGSKVRTYLDLCLFILDGNNAICAIASRHNKEKIL